MGESFPPWDLSDGNRHGRKTKGRNETTTALMLLLMVQLMLMQGRWDVGIFGVPGLSFASSSDMWKIPTLFYVSHRGKEEEQVGSSQSPSVQDLTVRYRREYDPNLLGGPSSFGGTLKTKIQPNNPKTGIKGRSTNLKQAPVHSCVRHGMDGKEAPSYQTRPDQVRWEMIR